MALGARYRQQLARSLEAMEILPLWIPDIPVLPRPVRGHADLALLHLGNEYFIAAQELPKEIIHQLYESGANLSTSKSPMGEEYPADCGLNAAIIGQNIIMNPETVCFKPPADLHPVNVRQGYSRCNICIVDANSIITSDAGIANAAENQGLDVLFISAGHIHLEGYDTGFIGGCAFKTAQDEIAFTGSTAYHPDAGRISNFLASKGIKPRFLTDDPLFDIGGAVLITEEI